MCDDRNLVCSSNNRTPPPAVLTSVWEVSLVDGMISPKDKVAEFETPRGASEF
jgi:hypothetical protein